MWKFKSLQKPLVLLFLLCLFPLGTMAQSPVKGTVNDEAGEPIIGATVKVQGSNEATITDFDGNYSLNAASDATLVFSYIGYVTQEVNVGGKSTINVTMSIRTIAAYRQKMVCRGKKSVSETIEKSNIIGKCYIS